MIVGDVSESPLRIGTLGAARITPMALLRPAREVAGVRVVAVAARDAERARRFAARHGIEKVHPSYEALLADPEVDAVYNPLPNGLHCEWSVRALEAGKHVLCEKPLASNEAEARQMAQAAERAGRVLAEAFHWRYHPLAARVRELLDQGVLGRLRHVEASMCIPLPLPGDIRYRYDLAGGAAMDTGCYAVSIARFLAGAEPEVVSAEMRLASPKVDRFMRAELRFPGGTNGRVTASLLSARLLDIRARAVGERGELSVLNPVLPQLFHRLRLTTPEGVRRERVAGDGTYTHQLRAFVRWVREGVAMPTDAAHGVANMRVLDAIYRAAGLPLRGV
jgi:predicted dehydrogenase